MEFGVCIIALGYDLYGTCALNLALSLKVHQPDLQIALLCEPKSIKHLSEKELDYFDYLIEVKETDFAEKNYFRVKLLLNKYSPFDKTIYLDSDNILFDKKISLLYQKFQEKDFCIGYIGDYDYFRNKKTSNLYSYWTPDEKLCCEYHGLSFLPQTISGFLYFKKCEWVSSMFEEALRVYDDPDAPCESWGSGRPDEYCFNVALGKFDYKQEPYNPLYFDKLHGYVEPYEIYNNYFGIAMGGHRVSKMMIELHDKLVNKYCQLENLQPRYHINKANVITERNKH